MTQPIIIISSNPHEYSEGTRSYRFAVNLDKYTGSCNTFNDLSNILSVPKNRRSKFTCF